MNWRESGRSRGVKYEPRRQNHPEAESALKGAPSLVTHDSSEASALVN
jgi:hypothetical protein